VYLHAEIAEAFQVAGKGTQGLGVGEREVDVHLEPNAIERHASRPEILRHRVNRVGLGIHRLGVEVIIEKLGCGIVTSAGKMGSCSCGISQPVSLPTALSHNTFRSSSYYLAQPSVSP